VGEFADRQPVQAQPQHVVGFLSAFDDLLQFGQDMAVQEPEQRPVDVQRVDSGETDPGQQREDVFELPQRTLRPHPQWRREGPSHHQRHHVWVCAR